MVAGEGGLIFFEVIPLGFTKVYLFDLILYILANDFSIVFKMSSTLKRHL